jgi:tRNA A37 threonylcarbamoyltransferase TsaD
MEKHNVKCVGIGGGVGANNLLKNELAKLKTKKIFLTSKKWCGDNGSMIAFYTYLTL